MIYVYIVRRKIRNDLNKINIVIIVIKVMNNVCITGLNVFLYQTYIHKSIIPLVVYLNGILYHSNPSSKKLKYYDLTFNILLIFYCNVIAKYKSKKGHIFSIIGCLSYLINYKKKSNVIHALGPQFIGSLALHSFLNKQHKVRKMA